MEPCGVTMQLTRDETNVPGEEQSFLCLWDEGLAC